MSPRQKKVAEMIADYKYRYFLFNGRMPEGLPLSPKERKLQAAAQDFGIPPAICGAFVGTGIFCPES